MNQTRSDCGSDSSAVRLARHQLIIAVSSSDLPFNVLQKEGEAICICYWHDQARLCQRRNSISLWLLGLLRCSRIWCLKCQMLSERLGLLKQLIRTDTLGVDFSGRKYIFISEREEGHAAQCQETSHPKMSLSRTSHCLIHFSLIYSSIHK